MVTSRFDAEDGLVGDAGIPEVNQSRHEAPASRLVALVKPQGDVQGLYWRPRVVRGTKQR